MNHSTDFPNSRYEHLYAILRYDLGMASIRDAVTVVKVLTNRDAAETEAERLQKINDETKCIYDIQITRLVRTSEEAEN